MKLENTIYANHQLVIDENGKPFAVQIDGEIKYRVGDRVRITDDGHGYICPGIHHPGIGTIVDIRRDDTDHFYGVMMDNGKFGYMKDNRMERF